MSFVTTAETTSSAGDTTARVRVAKVLGTIIFAALIPLYVITAIPYGTVEAWWKALFVCAAFALAILWLIEGYLSNSWVTNGRTILAPVFAIVLFSLMQTISLGAGSLPGISSPAWRTISVDPYQTRFFAFQIAALGLYGLFLFRYLTTTRRLMIVANLVIGIAFVSAIYGILRQTTQHKLGFGLPLLQVGMGYGQFVNKNHFAFLMEMALGLILGLILRGGVKRERILVYVAALLPIWTALVLCRSRGGVIAMLLEVGVAAFLLSAFLPSQREREAAPTPKWAAVLQSAPLRIGLFVIIVCSVLFGTLYLGGEPLASSLKEARTEFDGDVSGFRQVVSRNEIWATTLKIFAAHPVAGAGMGAYWAAVPPVHDASGALTPQEAHNDYLELLATGGVVGFAIGIWFIFAVARKIKTNLRSPVRLRSAACLGATIGLAAVAVHSLLDFGLHMMVNALVFTTLIVIATSEQAWNNETTRES